MFDTMRRIMNWIIGIVAAYYLAGLLVMAGFALLSFVVLVAKGRFSDAAIAYLPVALVGGIIAFGFWVYHDARASSQRLEKHLTPKVAAVDDADEHDDDDLEDPKNQRPSEQIRPSPDH